MKKTKYWLGMLTGRSSSFVGPAMQAVQTLFDDVTNKMSFAAMTETTMRSRYIELQQGFDMEQQTRWANYVKTVQTLWAFSLGVLAWAFLLGDWITGIEAAAMFLFVWVSLGYRIWVLRMRLYPGFIQYLKMFHTAPFAGVPVRAKTLME